MLEQVQAAADEAQPKTRVFLSYSRKDGAFAETLRVALIAAGFEAYLDKEDILPGEPWRNRLEQLIRGADAVVFVISPDSIASEHCQWEVERTLELRKALVPLLWRPVPDGAVPPGLSELNYVLFDAYERSGLTDEAAFAAGMGRLQIALAVAEALWVRDHTKWVARAAEWDKSEPPRPEGKLLPPGDLAAAEAWARLRPATAPEVPPVLAEYLRESRDKHERDSLRQRRIIGRAFVKPAEEARKAGRAEDALRLAAAGVLLAKDLGCDRHVDTQLWGPAARAISETRTIAVLKGHSGSVEVAAFSPDGQRIVTASSDKSARIWDAATGQQVAVLQGHTDSVGRAGFSPDGQRIVTASNDTSARLWDAATAGRLWDVSRSAAMAGPPAVVLIATLARGIGWRTDRERADLLMQDAPDDLFAEALKQLGRPADDPEIAEIAARLRAPLHPNCYLSPTQFAEKFAKGSDPSPPAGEMEREGGREGSDPVPAPQDAAAAVPAAATERANAAKGRADGGSGSAGNTDAAPAAASADAFGPRPAAGSDASVQSTVRAAPSRGGADRSRGRIGAWAVSFLAILTAAVAAAAALAIAAVADRALFGGFPW